MRISICIPTRERVEYLRESLATVVAIDDSELEIIVSDNASADDTRAVVERIVDPRITYVNTGKRLSMRQNFENAVSLATGEYVIIIGDDDAMVPGQFAFLRHLLETRRPECLSWRSRYYLWPDKSQPDGGGRLKLSRNQCFGPLTAHPSAGIIASVAASTLGGHGVVPMIYHGAARRDVLERLKERTGGVFLSSVPDVYFQVAANAVAGEVLFAEHPFSIQAISPKSTGYSARFAQAGQDSAVADFSREADADPVIDPMPGRLPGIELYWLNALEQANRTAFGGTLPIRYDLYIAKALKGLAGRSEREFEQARATLLAFVETLPGRTGLRAMVEQARPESGMRRVMRSCDDTFKRLRRFQPSLTSRSRVILDLKAFGLGSVADAARVVDFCLGPSGGDGNDGPQRQRSAMARGSDLVWRALMRRGLPTSFGAS
jgi:hypothetical protein